MKGTEVKSLIDDSIRGVRVLLAGDLMLDRYWRGKVSRMSPEAPVPVLSEVGEISSLGGAANVAMNLLGFGAQLTLTGSVGRDGVGTELLRLLSENGISSEHIVVDEGRHTTVKTRIIANGQQLARVDNESTTPISEILLEGLKNEVSRLAENHDVVLISDYAKGFLTPDFIKTLIDAGRRSRLPVIIDPKGNDFTKYRGANLLTPNEAEARIGARFLGCDSEDLETIGKFLLSSLDLEALLLTRGENGMLIFEGHDSPCELAATARQVFDVTGAGDTVVAAMAAGMGSGLSVREAARLANWSAGKVVELSGTTAFRLDFVL